MSQYDRQMTHKVRVATNGEVPFDPGELFYSRTDKRGVIIEGNQVFQRVSGYSWSELRGAPQKVVRHPDMPRGLFHMFWERLKAGQKMVFYLKNKSKDGRAYWVLALAWPIEGGYIFGADQAGDGGARYSRERVSTASRGRAREGVDPGAECGTSGGVCSATWGSAAMTNS